MVASIMQAILAGVASDSVKLYQTTCEPLTGAQYLNYKKRELEIQFPNKL